MMIAKKIFVGLILCFLFYKGIAQQIYTKCYFNATNATATNILSDIDSASYILSYSNHIEITKIDYSGTLLWAKSYNRNSLNSIASSFIMDSNSIYIAGASLDTSNPNPAGNYFDLAIIKAAKNGAILSSFTLGSDTLNDFLWKIIKTKDNMFVAVGYANDISYLNNGRSDAVLIKFDSMLSVQWIKTYSAIFRCTFNSIVESDDGYFYIAGSNNNIGFGYSDGLLVKTDTAGNLIWSKSVDQGYSESFYDIHLVNNKLILCGVSEDLIFSTSYGTALMETDTSGNILFYRKYFGPTVFTNSFLFQKSINEFLIIADRYIIRIDSTCNVINGYKYNAGFKAIDNFPDGGFVCASTGPGIFVLKLDSVLNSCSKKSAVFIDSLIVNIALSNCYIQQNNNNTNLIFKSGFYEVNNNLADSFYCLTATELFEHPLTKFSYSFKVVPNPITNSFQIDFDKPLNQNTHLQVCDLTGRIVYSTQINSNVKKIMIDVSMLGQGTYFLKANSTVRKIIKM